MEKLASAQTLQMTEQGYLLVPEVFSPDEVALLRDEAHRLTRESARGRVYEVDGRTPRAIHGCHQENELFARLVRLPRLVSVAEQLLGSQVNVLQFKINFKDAFRGDRWGWHQDYIYFHNEDGLPSPRFFSMMIFLDRVTEQNGPVLVMPGSNRYGMIPTKPPATPPPPLQNGDLPEWVRNFSIAGKFNLSDEVVERLRADHGVVSATGEPGTLLFIDGNIVHGSAANGSPTPRCLLIITYNSVDNPLTPRGKLRPEFLVSQSREPITPWPADRLLPELRP